MRRASLPLMVWISLLTPFYVSFAQTPGDIPLPTIEQITQGGIDELQIRLAPIPAPGLETVRDRVFDRTQEVSTALADALIRQMKLRQTPEPDPAALGDLDSEVEALMLRRSELASRASIILDALERNGVDVAKERGYLSALDVLRPAEAMPVAEEPDPAEETADASEEDQADAVRKQAAELVAIIRAEPPAHERAVPWDVPIAEFELELQPLAIDSITDRLEKWQELLQREIRKRVRIDILINNAEKLEQTRELRRQVAIDRGEPVTSDLPVDEIKASLAERSQEQQRIINAIVERMEVAIRLIERRGGEGDAFAGYITAATGQKLNLTDFTVLRAQLLAWLRSPDGGLRIGLAFLQFIAVVGAFFVLSVVLGRLILAGVRRVPRASSLLGPVLAGAVRRLTLIIGVVIGVGMLGVNIGPLLAMIGAAGLVIGLALQGTLSNFASGILILLNRPYDVGHVIEAGGVFGKVEAMNLVSTSVLTFDNKLMLVPNNQIWNGVITNVTGKSTRRVDLSFGIGYADDMERAIEVIREVVSAHPMVNAEPETVIKVHELGDNSVNIVVRPWTNTENYWDVYWDLTHGVKARFDAEDINIPFPQRDIHVPGPIEIKFASEDRPASLAGASS